MLVAVVMPKTSTGVVCSIVVPSPSPPKGLSPQHITVLFVSRAHELRPPRAMLEAVVMFDTSTGTVLSVVVPSPSWP